MRNVLFIFGQLTDEDVDWMARIGTRRRVADATTLIREGERIDAVYLLIEGALSVARQGERTLAQIGPGEMFGEMSFVDASPPSASVTTAGPAVVLEIGRDHLEERLSAEPGFAGRFFRAVAMMLSDRLRNVESRLGASASLEPNELDPNVLDGLSAAGERFDRLVRHAFSAVQSPAERPKR